MQRFILLILVILLAWSICPAGAADDKASIIEKRMELTKNKPFTSIVPRSAEPTGYINVLRLWPESNEMKLAIASLQGIVNREKPQLYIGIDKPLRWLEYYGGQIVIEPTERDIFKIFEKFKDSIKGIVVYDYSIDALANVAITYAGIEDLIPADPELAKILSEKYGWKVVHDLRGRWNTRYEAYRWAYDNLFDRCSKYALTHYNHGIEKYDDPSGPNSETSRTGHMVDYAVAFRTFTWHVPTEPTKEEMKLAEQIFESVAFHTPIFGRSSSQKTYPEPAFVAWVAEYGNLHIPAGMSNTSVLSGARLDPDLLIQKPMPTVRDMGPDKIYIAFTISEKDNLEHVLGGGAPWQRSTMDTDDPYKIWWSDPWRGRIAIGWPIGPLVAEIAPTTLAHFTTTATDNDCLMVALSGLCLSEPESYGAAYPELQKNLLDEYCQMTGDFMKRLNWTIAQPVGMPGILKRFIQNIPTMQGIMEGYTPHKGMTPEKADYMLDGVPVFHALTYATTGTARSVPLHEMNQRKVIKLVDEIKGLNITERPAFIHSWIGGWDFGPTTLKMAADLLPDEYVFVRPDELAALYKKYKGNDNDLTTVRPNLTPSGKITVTANGTSGLIIDTGKIKAEIGWGNEPQPPLKRIMGVDGKWRGTGKLLLNNPNSLSTKSFDAKVIKDTPTEKQYQLTYVYSNDSSMILTLQAIAGHPYILVKEQSSDSKLPSWGFDVYTDFQPDFICNDAWSDTLEYKGSKAMGGMPWSQWVLTGRKEGTERDLIGVFTMSWIDWSNGTMIFWQRSPGAIIELYQTCKGSKEFAIAALDRNDLQNVKEFWSELNSK